MARRWMRPNLPRSPGQHVLYRETPSRLRSLSCGQPAVLQEGTRQPQSALCPRDVGLTVSDDSLDLTCVLSDYVGGGARLDLELVQGPFGAVQVGDGALRSYGSRLDDAVEMADPVR